MHFHVIIGAALSVASVVEAGPPAVPLIAHDPYLSVWSMRDKLTDDWPRHWSGSVMGMAGMLRVGGKTYRWCGPAGAAPEGVAVARQNEAAVQLTDSVYTFIVGEGEGQVTFTVTFSGPPGTAESMVRASRSVSVIGFEASGPGARAGDVAVYMDITGEWCTNDAGDRVYWSRHRVDGMEMLSMSRVEQPVLEHAGDGRKIDWGRVYFGGDASTAVGGHRTSRELFAKTGRVATSDDLRMPRAADDDWPVLAAVVPLVKDQRGRLTGELLLGYDEGEAIELFGRKLKPLWASGAEGGMGEQLTARMREWEAAQNGGRVAFEPDPGARRTAEALSQEAERVGGKRYADLLVLAYRQVMAGHKVVADWDGTPAMFSKENTSNGCIGTVDVIYPACPFFLYHNPAMLSAQLRPLLQYAASPRWRFPFAPHDLGTYPKANGQVYGGGERTDDDQMPVEESGNMLIMLAALTKVSPEQGLALCQPYWGTLEKWAAYLKEHGLDPANQLCTDDFAGHLARNVNLSAKTVVALGAYAQLLGSAGKTEEARLWRDVAEQYARRWEVAANAGGGEATLLVFGDAGQGTWSQKYNLVWDRALGLNLFPQAVYKREMALYRGKMRKYGLPLDSRRTYTKLDWTAWTACLTGSREDFDAVMAPVFDWANASPPPSRVPLTDWYDTVSGRAEGFAARTVVGGLWMPVLIDRMSGGNK